jgi:hypothetical protein
MIRKTSKERGVNVIAMVLMLITFFLVIGFGIGALATMNLNLSGRSVTTVKSNQLAEAAVAQFLTCVSEKAKSMNAEVYMNELTPPPLGLDTYYDGCRNIFEPIPPYKGDDCNVDVHFVKLNGQDKDYSTDNLNSSSPVMGARGLVPPLTVDLIVNVTVGSAARHYQVWVTRKWDYVLYCEEAPIYLTSAYDPTAIPLTILQACFINGSIFSKFSPNPTPPAPYPTNIFIGQVPTEMPSPTASPTASSTASPNPIQNEGMQLAMANLKPGRTHPASIMVGGPVYLRENTETNITLPPVYSYTYLYTSEGNMVNGKAVFSFPSPTPSPGWEIHLYPNNNDKALKKSVFNSTVTSPIANLVPLDDSMVACEDLYSDEYPMLKFIENDYYGLYRLNSAPAIPPVTVNEDINGLITDPVEKGLYDTFTANVDSRKAEYAEFSRPVIWASTGFTTKPPASTQYFQWGEKSRYVIKDDFYGFLPLVDVYNIAAMDVVGTIVEDYGAAGKKMTYTAVDKSDGKVIQGTDNKITINNSMIVAKKSLELRNSQIIGDNAMLQVDGNITLCSGKISAGKNIGTVVFCNNFFCASSGTFNGVIIARNSVRIGNGADSDIPNMRGAIICGGTPPDPDPTNHGLENGGIVASGLRLTYDPGYMKVLNRFGKFRVTYWREI